jgi:aspartate-semialdehyde dehydrogenase
VPESNHATVAIVGATGLVGREFLSMLQEHPLGDGEVRLLASTRSAGSSVPFRGRVLPVDLAAPEAFDGVDLAFFSAGASVSRELAPAAVGHGAVVIDNSSAFRMEESVPLIVPEVNGHALDDWAPPGIIANPNCSTIIALLAVTPLHRAAGVERMVASTYQAASGAGEAVFEELQEQAREFAAGRPYTTKASGRQYLFNVYSHDSPVGDDGYNEEERKLLRETHKIWADSSVRITATCVRVPVLRAHCESINLTFRRPLREDEARAILARAPGVRVVDDRWANRFPEPVDAAGIDEVLVGRIRADSSQPPGLGLNLFVAGDQLRKGAALNAVQIAQLPTVARRAAASAAGRQPAQRRETSAMGERASTARAASSPRSRR